MIQTARTEPAFLASGRRLLVQAFRYLEKPPQLVGCLWNVLGFFADIDVLVVSRTKAGEGQLFLCRNSAIGDQDWDYFLRFCKQDILRSDRFADVENLTLVDCSPMPRPSNGVGRIQSYTSFPLTDPEGSLVGRLHLGSFQNHYFNPIVVNRLTALLPFLGSLLAKSLEYQDLRERKENLLSLFSKFLPVPVIQKLLEEQRLSQNSVARKSRVVILFSDIRSFTSITEQNGAEAVVRFLNGHFQAMVTEIVAQGGVIDKFIGDAIVAVFDAEDRTDACHRALRAARNMLARLPEVDVSSVSLDQGRYGIGIGLHMGDAVAGSIGSAEKMAYTVVGDVIEHAEELESETKHYRVGLLMSRAVAEAVSASDLPLINLSDPGLVPEDEQVFTLGSPP